MPTAKMPLQKQAFRKTPVNNIEQEEENIEGQLALDVYQTPNEIVIVAPIAGVKMNDISVTVTEDVLTIKGKRYLEFNIPDEDYLTQESFPVNCVTFFCRYFKDQRQYERRCS